MIPTRKSIMPGFGVSSTGFAGFDLGSKVFFSFLGFWAFLSVLEAVAWGVGSEGSDEAERVSKVAVPRDLVTISTVVTERAAGGRH